jgi:hypothetical protein
LDSFSHIWKVKKALISTAKEVSVVDALKEGNTLLKNKKSEEVEEMLK